MVEGEADIAPTGLFLSFEGPEGSGKTTQVARLQGALLADGHPVLLVREPGGTAVSERVRQILLEPGTGELTPWSELCLYVAARAQLVEERIRPALRSGTVVLADRYGDSSVAYQGVARGIGIEEVETLNRWATGGLEPGLTVLFDLDPGVGLARVDGRGRKDRVESEPLAFHRRVREGYLELARRNPSRFFLIDATGSEESVFALLLDRVREFVAGAHDAPAGGEGD